VPAPGVEEAAAPVPDPAVSRYLIQISSTVRSSRWRCNGPNPATASYTDRAVVSGSGSGGNEDVSALVVLGDDLLDQPADGRTVVDRVQAAAADQLADLGLDGVDGAHWCSGADGDGLRER
jgi:hypothetical protein